MFVRDAHTAANFANKSVSIKVLEIREEILKGADPQFRSDTV
jgi:hypothetical protein